MPSRRALLWLLRAGVPALMLLAPALLAASDPIKGIRKFNPDHETVDVFSAAEQGKLEVRLITKDASDCRVLITNKTDRPLNVRVPEALAGVPVLAQFFPGFDDQNNRDTRSSNAPQQVGIGNPFGNQPGGNQQMFNVPGGRQPQANPFFAPFNVAPEKVAQLHLASVCLDHGHPGPRPVIPYRLVPLNSVTEEIGVREICAMLARGKISQKAAQAAAWHLNNHLSWDELRAKRLDVAFGLKRPYFTKRELAEGEEAADEAVRIAKGERKKRKSPSLSMN